LLQLELPGDNKTIFYICWGFLHTKAATAFYVS